MEVGRERGERGVSLQEREMKDNMIRGNRGEGEGGRKEGEKGNVGEQMRGKWGRLSEGSEGREGIVRGNKESFGESERERGKGRVRGKMRGGSIVYRGEGKSSEEGYK